MTNLNVIKKCKKHYIKNAWDAFPGIFDMKKESNYLHIPITIFSDEAVFNENMIPISLDYTCTISDNNELIYSLKSNFYYHVTYYDVEVINYKVKVNQIKLIKSDNKEYTYNLKDGYFDYLTCDETDDYIIIINKDYNSTFYNIDCVLYDKFGNKITLSTNAFNNKQLNDNFVLETADNKTFNLNTISQELIEFSFENYKVSIDSLDDPRLIYFYRDNKQLYLTTIEYSNSNIIITKKAAYEEDDVIKYKDLSQLTITDTKERDNSRDIYTYTVDVYERYSPKKSIYIIENKNVVKCINWAGLPTSDELRKKFSYIEEISYYDNYTIIKDYNNFERKFIFNNNLLSNVINIKGDISGFDYNENGYLIKKIDSINFKKNSKYLDENILNESYLRNKISSLTLPTGVSLDFNNTSDYFNHFNITNTETSEEISFIKSVKLKRGTGFSFFYLIKVNESLYNINSPLIRYRLTKKNNYKELTPQDEKLYVIDENEKIYMYGNICILDDDYDYLNIHIKASMESSIDIIGLQAYNLLLGSIYEYSEFDILKNIYSYESMRKRGIIEKDRKPYITSESSDNISKIINYDNDKNPIEIYYSDGIYIKNTYNNNNLIKQEKYGTNNKYQDEKYEYNDDRTLRKLTSVNDVDTLISREKDNRLISEVISNNKRIQNMYTDYNELSKKRFYLNDNNGNFVDYEYGYSRLSKIINKISIGDNYKYSINNSFINKTFNIKINDNLLEGMTYFDDTYLNENLLTKHVYSNGDCFHYEYDVYGNLIKCSIGENDAAVETYYEYEYDYYNRLTKISDLNEGLTKEFLYDKYDNVVYEKITKGEIITESKYIYDNYDNLLMEKTVINNGKPEYIIYSSNNNKKASPVLVHNYYKYYDDNLYTCFLLSSDNEGNLRTSISNSEEEIELINNLDSVPEISSLNNGSLHAFKLDGDEKYIKYSMGSISYSSTFTCGFWFKEINDNSSTNTIKEIARIKFDKTHTFTLDNNYIYKGTYKTINTIKNNDWNFISFTFVLETIVVNLNGVITLFNYDYHDTYGPLELTIESEIKSYVTSIFIKKYGGMNEDEVNLFYKNTYKHLINYHNDTTYDYPVTTRYTGDNNMTIIPLMNCFNDIDNTIKYEFIKDSLFTEELNNIFMYTDVFNYNYAFETKGHKLIYDVSFENYIMACIKGYKYTESSSVVLEFGDTLMNGYEPVISLFLSEGDYVYLLIKNYSSNDELIDTGLRINKYNVNKYYISIHLYDEYDGIYAYAINIRINETCAIRYYETDMPFNINKLTIGMSGNNNYLFNGLVNMLCISNNNVSLNNITCLDKTERYIKTVDNMGFLNKEEVVKDEEIVLTKEYIYKEDIVDDKKKCYNIVEEEKIYTNSEVLPIRNIIYDTNPLTGNVIKRQVKYNDSIYEEKEYTYSPFGYLKEEKNNISNTTVKYSYNTLGNITKVEKINNETEETISIKTFGYDDAWQDRLTIVNENGVSRKIEYNETLFGMPSRVLKLVDNEFITEYSLDWFRNKLVKYNYNTNKYIDYRYDANGLRIEKKLTDNIRGGYIKHNYRYIGNKLIEELIEDEIKGDTYKVKYLYDERGVIYGFEYNNNTYYYIRDILQTIIGIMNTNKEIVCEYEYDSWGNHKVLGSNRQENTNSSFIGNINSIRYKGYYYDEETQLYWVSSRYYSPELCRWISPDSIEYLDPESINGLNLYCYCKNNPIMYVDPSGHSVILAMLIGAGIGFAAGLASQVVSDVVANVWENGLNFSEWQMSSWQSYVGAGLGGAIGGMFSPFLGAVAVGLITGTASTAITMGLSNATGETSYGFGEIVASSLLIGMTSGLTAGIVDNIKIPKLNAGRNSWNAISKQINTKLIKGTINNVSEKTLGKMFALSFLYSAPFTAFNSAFTILNMKG